MKKLVLITVFVCVALWGCAHDDGRRVDTALDAPGGRILDTRWKLVELWGKPVADTERHPFIQLHSKDGRMSGFGGCNSLSGAYDLKTGMRLRFTNMAATMMACPDMELEREFFNVLNMTDNFACDGKTLFLHKARMAPLARFEAAD